MHHTAEINHKRILRSLKAKANAKRTLLEKTADTMTAYFGSNTFLFLNIFLFAVWIILNTNIIPGLSAFDPFPFMLLTTFVSLEAIILSIFVLISQNRASRIDDLREETHLQLNLIAEREVTKLIKMQIMVLEKNGIDVSGDPELKKMLRPLSEEEIERRLEREIL